MSGTTLAVWGTVLAAGAFMLINAYFRRRKHPGALTQRQRAVRVVIVAAWIVAAVVTPVFGHDGRQPGLTEFVAFVVVACIAVGLVDFVD